ncbi:MAG: hypothetical protein PHV37_01550 [Candidatus Gastranaerophilales bacterium]|nr:hypothetical protein [Candidatus Gastranaerophilales bacterium]
MASKKNRNTATNDVQSYNALISVSFDEINSSLLSFQKDTKKDMKYLYGTCFGNAECFYDKVYSKYLQIEKKMPSQKSKACTVDADGHPFSKITFYTKRGFVYSIDECGRLLVDLNGDLPPNLPTTKAITPQDGGYIFILDYDDSQPLSVWGPGYCMLYDLPTKKDICNWSFWANPIKK